jgi:hypothetical protein
MKFHLTMRKALFLMLAFLSLASVRSRAEEFVIMNRVISWDINSGDGFWSFKTDATMPANWQSPINYYYGNIYTRYELLKAATNTKVGMQFDLFQWKNPEHTIEGELCESVRWLENGVGSVLESSSSPSIWWSANGGVDFTKISDLQSLSVTIWSSNPVSPICKAHAGGDDAGLAWENRFSYFPCEVRVTIVAVSMGSTFSGWENYVPNPSTLKPTPNYSVDFINETTDKVVPSTDEYSMFPEMTYAVSGNNQKVTLTPGRRYYFRTKAGNGLKASNVQILVVPERPATPLFALDAVNNRTTTLVDNTFEYSDDSDMRNPVSGSGDYVSIAAGTTKYFRKKSTAGSFKSNMQSLNSSFKQTIPHEFVIFNGVVDYPNGTDTNGFYYFWHNADMPVNWLTPDNYYNGQVYYRYEILSEKTNTQVGLQFGIWQKCLPETGELYETMSEIKTLNGAGSSVSGNSSPSTWWKLNGGVDYSRMNTVWHFGINPWKVSTNQQIRQENPTVWNERNTYWFPMKVYVTVVAVASGYSFSGWSNYLGVKSETPSYTFSYNTMETDQPVPTTDEYSYSPTMSPAYSGTGNKVAITPGQDIYFRTKAQGIYTVSDIQRIDVPDRPATPSFAIDYSLEKTTAEITSDYEYGYQSDMSDAVTGNGSKLDVEPGITLYFRKPGTTGSFASLIQTLTVPSRTVTPSFTINYATARTNELIPSGIDYSTSLDMSNATSGSNTTIIITPGTDLYFKTRATASSFCSDVFFLDVKVKPAAPSYTINFETETTNETVSDQIEFSEQANFTGASIGTNEKLQLVPGQTLWFRQAASSTSFNSDAFQLTIPDRSLIDYFGADTITTNQILLRAHVPEGESFTLSNLMVSNGTAQNLRGENVFDIIPASKGWVVVTIPVNSFSGSSFASNIVRIYYNKITTGLSPAGDMNFGVYPNPTSDGRICILNPQEDACSLDVISGGGMLVKSLQLSTDNYQYVDLSDLPKGIYFLKMNGKINVTIQKLIIE